MFDAPVETLYVWLGVATVSVVALGVAIGLPTATPPDATAVARAVDAVAVGPSGSLSTHALRAERIRLSPRRVGLAGSAGRAHATFAYGPVTPADEGGRLAQVLVGRRPSAVFGSPVAFADALRAARDRDGDWRPAPDRLVVRRVAWEGVNATLVG